MERKKRKDWDKIKRKWGQKEVKNFTGRMWEIYPDIEEIQL